MQVTLCPPFQPIDSPDVLLSTVHGIGTLSSGLGSNTPFAVIVVKGFVKRLRVQYALRKCFASAVSGTQDFVKVLFRQRRAILSNLQPCTVSGRCTLSPPQVLRDRVGG